MTETSPDVTFDFPEPTDLPQSKKLWATYYHVYNAQATNSGQPLLNMSGQSLGPLISERDWCRGAIEGTIRVTDLNGQVKVYNYAGRGDHVQVDCSPFIKNPSINITEIGRSCFTIARGPFGDGVQNMVLVPFRSIAVDKNFISFRSVVYIPDAHGMIITLPSGQSVTHDGYFYAADTGGAINENHIDVFSGISHNNPFPNFVKSRSDQTFDAFILTNVPQIAESLKKAHSLPTS